MLQDFLRVFVLYFVIMDPFASVPVFLASIGKKDVREAARVAVVSAGIVLLGFIVFGPLIFSFFGISLKSFKVGGGILLFLMAVQLVFHLRPAKFKEKVDVAASLIGVPLITGPGALALAAILTPTYGLYASVCGALLALLGTWLVLLNAKRIGVFLGERGVAIISGIMGILLAAIAVELVLVGLAV